jgi:hypothetical protein
MVEDMESLHKNETWDLFKLPNGRKLVDSKWVFKKKMNVAGQVGKFKEIGRNRGHGTCSLCKCCW